jgi:predicted ArsR family transcriptional regulator
VSVQLINSFLDNLCQGFYSLDVATRWDKRFFASTRGRIVALLRATSRTVDELADALGLTDNAVRAHLATLERDGLVEPTGRRRGVSKPAVAYDLTAQAEQLFPKAYEPVLRELVAVVGERLGPGAAESLLRETGRRLAAGHRVDGPLRVRLENAVAVFGELGGTAAVEEQDGRLFLRGRSCPLAGTVAGHSEVCRLGETLIAELIGTPVRTCCEVGDRPRCCFEVLGSEDAA